MLLLSVSFHDTGLPFCFSQSLFPLTSSFVSLTDFKTLLVVFKSSSNFINVDKSFGKQCPPNPKSPSGPGTFQCEFPNLSSKVRYSTTLS